MKQGKINFFSFILVSVSILLFLNGIALNSLGQCSGNLQGSYNTNTCLWQTQNIGSGEYCRFYVYRCREYRFELSGVDNGWTYVMTGRDDGNTTTYFNPSTTSSTAANWTATYTGYIRVYVNRNNCGTGWQGNYSSVLRYRDNSTNGSTSGTSLTWRGGVNTNWSTTTNWDCNTVPTSISEVLIPAPCVNNPTIGASTNATVKCIKVDGANGAILTVNPTNPNITAVGTSLTGICQ